MDEVNFTIVLITVFSLIVPGLAKSNILLDHLQPVTSSESLIRKLLEQYVDNERLDTGGILQGDATGGSGLEGIREAIRRRFDLYISQVKEVHGLHDDDLDLSGVEEHADQQARSRRHRRAVITADTVLPGRRRRNITQLHETIGSQVVRVVYPLNPQPFTYQKLSDLNAINTKEESYLFGLEVTDSGTYTCIYSAGKELKPKELARELTAGATKIEVCEIDSQLYVLPVEYNETSTDPIDAGSNLFRFDPSTRKLLKQQTIDTTYASAIHFWTGTGEEANDAYLSVAPEYKHTSKGRTFDVEVSIYRWQAGYFDYVYSLKAYNPQSIRHAGILSRGYLAIANYQDDSGSTSVYSEIFRYNHKESKYVSFQKIRTQGAKSIEFFGMTTGEHEDHFLAIANHCEADRRGQRNYRQKSHIFKYGLDRFIPFQTFETYGAFQFLSVKMESKSFLVLGEISGVRIFQYNGWKFTETYKLNLDYESLNPSLINFRPLIHGSEPYFTIASSETNIEGGVYALEFHQKNDYNEMAAEFDGECKKALARVNSENVPKLLEETELAPKNTDTEILLESSLEFANTGKLRNTHTQILIFSDTTFDEETSSQLAKRTSRVKNFVSDLRDMRTEAGWSVLRNENKRLTVPIRFENIEYHGKPFKATKVNAERLNGYRLNDIIPRLIHLNQNYSFDGLEIDTLITDHHIAVEKLNGDSISDFALKSSEVPQRFREKNKFSSSVRIESHLQVNGLFDDIDLNAKDFLLKTGNQTFDCDLSIQNSFVGNLITKSVNGVDLEYYQNEAVLRIAAARISGGKQFEKLYVASLDVMSSISTIDVDELYQKAILTNSRTDQAFTGRETVFASLETKQISLANPTLNDKWNLDDFVSISIGTYELDSVEFLEDTSVGQLTVGSSLNKIRVADDGELDLILKECSKVQRICNKVIETLHLEKDSSANGLVDGVNLTNWSSEKRIQLKLNRLRVGTFAPKGSLRVDAGIFVEKFGRFLFEGEDVTRHLQKSLLLNASELPYTFRGTLTFDSLIVLGNSELRTINRVSPSDWLTVGADRTETVVIRGQKTFNEKVSFLNSISVTGLYHTYRPESRFSYGQIEEVLGQLGDVLIDGRNQTIQRNTVFESVLSVNKLICPAGSITLQGIPFHNLLFRSLEQTLEGRIQFLKPVRTTSFFSINANLEMGRLNGYELNSLFKDTLMKYSKQPQVFKASAKFEGSLTVDNFRSDLIGGYNISQLLSNIVRKDLSAGQIIYGSLIFLNKAQLKNGLQFTGTLNGIGHEQWGNGLLLTYTRDRQVLHTPLRIKGGLTVKNITVANHKVSNYNVLAISKEILSIDQGGFLGVVYFTNTVIAEIDAKRVNGFNLAEDVLLKNGKKIQVITGTKSFAKGWEIDGSLRVGYLSGIDYNQAAKFAYGRTLPTDNLRIEGNLILKNEPFFQSELNGEEWRDIVKNIWWKDEPITISEEHEFASVTLEGGAELQGLFGGIELKDLENNYLSLTKDQRISSTFRFLNELEFGSITVEKLLLEKGRLNGLDLDEFRNSVFLHDLDQLIDFHVRFEELTVRGIGLRHGALVGGIDLNRDVMQLHGSNLFQRVVSFEELITDNLILANGTLINEVHLAEWLEYSLIASQPADISSTVEFHHAKFLKNVQVTGQVDGLKFSYENILTLSGDQTLQGLTTLANIVQVKLIHVKSGIVNGLNLEALVESLVLKDRGTGSIHVSGEKTFLQLLKADKVVMESLFQGYNINETLENLKPEAYISVNLNESLEERYKEMANLAFDLHQVAERQGVFLEYFEEAAKIELNPKFGGITDIKVLSYGHGATLFVNSLKKEKSTCTCTLSWGTYSSATQLSSTCIFKGILRGFVEIERESQAYLVVSLSSSDGVEPAEALLESKLTRTGYGELEKSNEKVGRTLILKLEAGGTWVIHQVLYANDFRTVGAFQLHLSNGHVRHCAVSLTLDSEEDGRAVVLCFGPLPPEVSTKNTKYSDGGVDIYQTLPVVCPVSVPALVRTLSTASKTFLVVSSGGAGSEVVDVWTHAPTDKKFVKEGCIPAVLIRSMALTETAGGQVLLAIATVVVADENQQVGRVYIYRYSETNRKFEKIQSLQLQEVLSIAFQSFDLISAATELLYVQAETSLNVYMYKGFAGFVLVHVIPTTVSNSLEATAHVENGTFRAEVLLTGPSEIQIFRAKLAGLRRYDHTGLEEKVIKY